MLSLLADESVGDERVHQPVPCLVDDLVHMRQGHSQAFCVTPVTLVDFSAGFSLIGRVTWGRVRFGSRQVALRPSSLDCHVKTNRGKVEGDG